MRGKLLAASVWTLGLLFGMLAAVVLLILYSQHALSAWGVFIITIALNVLMWLVSPKLTDLIQKFFYKATYYDQSAFASAYPRHAAFIKNVCEKNKIPFPKVGFISDDNPTAYSYGSGAWNARLVFTQGITTYLEDDEVEAVLAHELGHIVHRDFIVMSIANGILQLLYEIYYILGRTKGNDKKSGQLAVIGWVAYVFYVIGVYIVLFLNRLREYYADEFSAVTTEYSDALERALVKVAYGIMATKDDSRSTRLMESTRTMGIMSLQSAKSAGLAVKVTNMEPKKVARVLLFDIVSPWAKLAQISATHPLTGKRLLRLQALAVAAGKMPIYDMQAARQAAQLDKKKLWRGFFFGAVMYFMVWIVVIAAFVIGVIFRNSDHGGALAAGVSAAALVLLLARIFYRYPSVKHAQPNDVYDLMTDLYASPVRGQPVQLDGQLVGRGVPGYIFSEDMMMQDKTGLLYLDYQGGIPLFSNLMFALKKLRKIIGSNISASGWFFRSNIQLLRLKKINAEGGKTIRSYPRLWGIVGSVILAGALGLIVGAFATTDASTFTNLKTNINNARNGSPSASPGAPAQSTGSCYSFSAYGSPVITSLGRCHDQIEIVGSQPGANSIMEIISQPRIGTLSDELASWKKQPGNTIVSDQTLTVDNLPAEKFIYTAAGGRENAVVVFIDSSSRFSGSPPVFTKIMSSYGTQETQAVDEIISTLYIRGGTL